MCLQDACWKKISLNTTSPSIILPKINFLTILKANEANKKKQNRCANIYSN